MTVGDIIKAVRWCYDEEKSNNVNFGNASSNDNTLMDNIIKAKIGDALRWVCLYAPAELLNGTDGTGSTGILVDKANISPTSITGTTGGRIVLDATNHAGFIKIVRVRMEDWHRAIKEPISEDSEEYLQLYDSNGAAATIDRPQAAIIDKATKEIEVWPFTSGKKAQYTYVADPGTTIDATSADTDVLNIPPKVKTAFIYYLAFLVLTSYEDSRAARMLEIAKMNVSRTENTQNK